MYAIIGLVDAADERLFANISYVFLDREGILNRKPPEGQYVTRWHEFELLPGVESAIARLNRSGRKVILITNQRAIALGLMSKADLDAIHNNLRTHLAQQGAQLDAIYACPHDVGECHCRKPDVGLFEQAFADFPAARPDNSLMIGDSLSDIEAATRMGMASVFIAGDSSTQKPGVGRAAVLAMVTASSLPDCVDRFFAAVDS